jgi:hypothetical protein
VDCLPNNRWGLILYLHVSNSRKAHLSLSTGPQFVPLVKGNEISFVFLLLSLVQNLYLPNNKLSHVSDILRICPEVISCSTPFTSKLYYGNDCCASQRILSVCSLVLGPGQATYPKSIVFCYVLTAWLRPITYACTALLAVCTRYPTSDETLHWKCLLNLNVVLV